MHHSLNKDSCNGEREMGFAGFFVRDAACGEYHFCEKRNNEIAPHSSLL